MLIAEIAEAYEIDLDIQIRKDVDRELYEKENVITSDSIILDHCKSWMNLGAECISMAEMEASGRLDGVITQNIDGLHQKAGSKNVQEIHGTIWRNYCVSCKTEYDENFIFDNTDPIPRCPACGKTVRPDVTLYGEFLPEEAYQNAITMLQFADCLIIGGTSLEVGSAAQLALLVSIHEKKRIDLEDIMYRFADWLENGKYTPFGQSFDIGNATMSAIIRYLKDRDITTCGGTTDRDNGNGSLMRIMPACLYAYENDLNEDVAVNMIHSVAGLTHNHLRGQIACGLYYGYESIPQEWLDVIKRREWIEDLCTEML